MGSNRLQAQVGDFVFKIEGTVTYEETNRPLSLVIKANIFYLSRLVYVY